jgi:hypothetical protein
MAKRKETNRQTMIYKVLHRKLKIEQHELYKKPMVNPRFCRSLSTSRTRRATVRQHECKIFTIETYNKTWSPCLGFYRFFNIHLFIH